MLYTNLKHIEDFGSHARVIAENANVLMICGNMDPASVVMYRIAEELQRKYRDITFYDLECDHPDFKGSEIVSFQIQDRFPLLMFYKNSEIIKVVPGGQSKDNIIRELNAIFFDK